MLNLIREILSALLVASGGIFMLIATIGLMRLPDFYVRMSAIAKAGTLGTGLIVLGIGIYFNDILILTKVVAIVLFIFITSPISAHIIARAACRDKVPFWRRTVLDEFRNYLRDRTIIRVTDQEIKDEENS
jgi:multicomponent Na+:H+ antiporter subunit G